MTHEQPRSRNRIADGAQDARRVLGEYIDLGPRDPAQTVERLLAVLDREDFLHALDRINRRRMLRLLE